MGGVALPFLPLSPERFLCPIRHFGLSYSSSPASAALRYALLCCTYHRVLETFPTRLLLQDFLRHPMRLLRHLCRCLAAIPAKDLSHRPSFQGSAGPPAATGLRNFARPVALIPLPDPSMAHWCDRSFAATDARWIPAIHRERRDAPDRPQTWVGVPDGPLLLLSETADAISCAESMAHVPDELREENSLRPTPAFSQAYQHLISVVQ